MKITALYAGLLAPLFVLLAVQVIRLRYAHRIGVGDGGDPDLLRRMRVQANFAEYVPFALLLMALTESLGTRPWLLHALGVVLLLARVSHAFGMSQPAETMAFRSAGVAGTFGVLLIAAATCVVNALG